MNRMMAIVEREMRKFFRSPTLMLASMIFPLVQLIVLGNAFGGKIKDARLGVVDQDGGTQALKDPRGIRFCSCQHADLRAGVLQRRSHCAGRRAQRQDSGRRDHPGAVFAARLRAGSSADRTGRR